MLALAVMKPAVQAIFFVLAVVCFLVATFRSWAPEAKARIDFVALGLALFVFVWAWNAVATA